ncbi:MAG: hypothetical protein KGL96_03130, partial [Hyphomicrobiales bacterium]|nr:hypothetical protein [Hyphomicrobiales bacterium]
RPHCELPRKRRGVHTPIAATVFRYLRPEAGGYGAICKFGLKILLGLAPAITLRQRERLDFRKFHPLTFRSTENCIGQFERHCRL